MVDAETKFVPFTVSASVLRAAATEVGDSDVIDGTGLLELTVNVAAFEVPPPGVGLTTVTLGEPLLAISGAGTWAVSCVALT
jgi:hypothetical protein